MQQIHEMHRLAQVDLNLLKVFHAVYDTLHITQAARNLGISQPALSHAVRRLREVVGDPLFVKIGREMAPTPLAEQIAPTIAAMLDVIGQEILDRKPFVPATHARTFRIATTDYLESILAPPLLAHFAANAPNLRVAMQPISSALPAGELHAGVYDLAIAGFLGGLSAHSSFHRQLLFRDTFASAVRKEHPHARALSGPQALDAFCNEPHLLVAPSGDLNGAVDHALAAQKKARAVVAGTTSFMIAGWMTAESDCVLTAPSRLLEALTRFLPLRIFDTPVKLEPIEIVSVWHARMHDDPAHKWLREAIATTTGASTSAAGSAATATASASARGRTERKSRTRTP
jgi:DNA-binding transcriptional LysR family regulator